MATKVFVGILTPAEESTVKQHSLQSQLSSSILQRVNCQAAFFKETTVKRHSSKSQLSSSIL